MSIGKQITLFALDCGATNWRLYRAEYRLAGNYLKILGDPQPAPLTSFSDRVLPAAISLKPAGDAIDQIGEPAQAQLEDERQRGQVMEYFKPCIGAHLDLNPLPHQKRYTHAQALEFTRLLLDTILAQIRQEKWRASEFDDRLRFAFAYPVHWKYSHDAQILSDFKRVVLGCFPKSIHPSIRFVPEPEGAILSLKRQGLLEGVDGGVTLIVDVGGSTTDIVAGRVLSQTGELFYLEHYGKPFGGGLYDAALARYLADQLDIPASALGEDTAALATLRVYGQRLKESLSRQLLNTRDHQADQTAQRMITLVMRDGQVYRRMIRLDQAAFQRIAGHLDQSFQDLIAQAMKSIGLTESEIGQVALVGGGVQLFSIIRYLRKRFGEQKVVLADNPDEIVVRGVALEYGASLGTFEPGASLILQPVLPPEEKADSLSGWSLESPEGESYSLKPGVTKIGRARDSYIWLDSEKVSRHHAEIHSESETITLIDLGSTNGTFVNDFRLKSQETHLLKSNDELRFGDRKYILK